MHKAPVDTAIIFPTNREQHIAIAVTIKYDLPFYVSIGIWQLGIIGKHLFNYLTIVV